MSLTRRDIAETSIRTIAAFLTSVAIVGTAVGVFIGLAADLRAQQKTVVSVRDAVRMLVENQKNFATKADLDRFTNTFATKADLDRLPTKAQLDELLKLLRDQNRQQEAPRG